MNLRRLSHAFRFLALCRVGKVGMVGSRDVFLGLSCFSISNSCTDIHKLGLTSLSPFFSVIPLSSSDNEPFVVLVFV